MLLVNLLEKWGNFKDLRKHGWGKLHIQVVSAIVIGVD